MNAEYSDSHKWLYFNLQRIKDIIDPVVDLLEREEIKKRKHWQLMYAQLQDAESYIRRAQVVAQESAETLKDIEDNEKKAGFFS